MGYLNLVGSFVYKEPLFRAKLQALADNDAQLKTDGWAQNTETVFYQATVPAGWTQDVGNNDKALRVVGPMGGTGSGGSKALSSTISLAHVHAIPSDGIHTHVYANHTHNSGPSAVCGTNTDVIISNGGLMTRVKNYDSGGAASADSLKGVLQTPGALTLGSTDAHSHGTPTGSSLTDFVFAYCDIVLGVKNAPAGTYTDLTSQWHTSDIINFDPFATLAANDAYNKGALMPGGTIMIWGQGSSPVGWTRVISLTDRMLRVVSGIGGGVGGSNFISNGVTLAHANSMTTDPDHTHTMPAHQHQFGLLSSLLVRAIAPFLTTTNPEETLIQESLSGTHLAASAESGATATRTAYKTQTTNSGAGATDAAGAHTHPLVPALTDFTLAYLDVIQCSKDSSGEPYPYTDLTAEFAWKKLVSYQRLNSLAKNDAFIQYDTTPSGSQAFFFMATPPAGWTQLTSQHDKCLRIVDGATGGSPGGGAQLLSATIALAHTHGIPTFSDHIHTMSHTHPIDTATVATMTAPTNNYIQSQRTFNQFSPIAESFNSANAPDGQATFFDKVTQGANEPTAPAGSHNHGGVTDSKLTDIALAYCDVIWCTKD